MKHALIALFFASTSIYGVLAQGKASSDLSALDDATRSMITKEKMRASSFSAGSSEANQGNDSKDPLKRKKTTIIDGGITTGCDINIGNTTSKPGSNTKPTTVIITGPVIQLPGKGCK